MVRCPPCLRQGEALPPPLSLAEAVAQILSTAKRDSRGVPILGATKVWEELPRRWPNLNLSGQSTKVGLAPRHQLGHLFPAPYPPPSSSTPPNQYFKN